MRKKGIELRFGANIARIEKRGRGLRAVLDDGTALEADQILYATGRAPNIARARARAGSASRSTASGAVVVDEYSRTSVPSIWRDRRRDQPPEPDAGRDPRGMALARDAVRRTADPARPRRTCRPPSSASRTIGTVGLTEAAARARYGALDVYRTSFRAAAATRSPAASEQTLMKLVVDRASQRVVGAHMVGPDAGEIIQGIAIAMKCGATKAQFDATRRHPSDRGGGVRDDAHAGRRELTEAARLHETVKPATRRR